MPICRSTQYECYLTQKYTNNLEKNGGYVFKNVNASQGF